MSRKFNLVTLIVVLSFVVIILVVAPSGKILDTILSYLKISRGILIGLVLLGIVVVLSLMWVDSMLRANAKKVGTVFEELQSVLRSTLIPLGFVESEGSGLSRYAKYTRDNLSVGLILDVRDSIYYLTASSKPAPQRDFTIECFDLKKVDEFKSESIAKLNEWLVKQRVR